MAKPDLDEGYLRVAHELFAAIAVAGFTKWEMVVLREVFDQVYGPRKTTTARLSPSDIAGRIGTHRESIVRAIRTLVESGVLLKTAEGEFRFIKDYESWRHGNKPRLSPSETTYCATAKRIKASNTMRNNCAPPTGTVALQGGTTALHPPEQLRSATGAPALQERNSCAPPQVAPPTPPIEERVRKREEEEIGEGRENAPAPAKSSLGPEYTKVGELAIELLGDFGWGMWVSSMGKMGYPAAWIDDVVRKMAARGNAGTSLGYSILQRYQQQGGPDKPSGGFAKKNENHGKVAASFRPDETRSKIQRPDIPRTPETEAIHAMWDRAEASVKGGAA